MKVFVEKASVLVLLLALLFGPTSCNKTASGEASNVDYYTCTMHPSVRAKAPGKCPICGMTLVPVMKTSGSQAKASPAAQQGVGEMPGMPGMKTGGEMKGPQTSEFVVPVERQQQIGVTYARVERKPLQRTIRSVGMVVPDKALNWQFVARVDGYIQKLYVTAPGEIVEKDAPLLSIYSPDLLTSEREFVNLLRMRDEAKTKNARETPARLVESAKQRLRLWNVTNAQIDELERTRQPQNNLTLLSPVRGVIQSVPAGQGQNVKVGDMLVEVADLSVVWVWAEFYENELPRLKVGQKIDITASSYPGRKFQGAIDLIDPFLDQTKRTGKVRIEIANPKFDLQPGMFINAQWEMEMGTELTLPVSAVMPTGTRSIAFVNKGEGKLEPRVIQIGAQYGDSYELLSGLREGEEVVASANFLIDAESKVQGALKDFEPAFEPNESSPAPKQ